MISPYQQLLLDLKLEQPPSLDNFIAGDNAELLARLPLLADPACVDAVTLWGPSGCGKSHLLAAVAIAAAQWRPVLFLRGEEVADLAPPADALLVLDDIEGLGAEAQIALFRCFNSARTLGLGILLASSAPPLRLALREDLRTRVGQTLIYEVQPLSDTEKGAALERHAALRGMPMDAGVVRYLMRHGRRDLPSLMAMLDGLDRASLEQKRLPTVPLLKELMQTSLDLDPT